MDNKQPVDQLGPENTPKQQQQQIKRMLSSYKPIQNFSDEEVCLVFGSVIAVLVVFCAMLWFMFS